MKHLSRATCNTTLHRSTFLSCCTCKAHQCRTLTRPISCALVLLSRCWLEPALNTRSALNNRWMFGAVCPKCALAKLQQQQAFLSDSPLHHVHRAARMHRLSTWDKDLGCCNLCILHKTTWRGIGELFSGCSRELPSE